MCFDSNGSPVYKSMMDYLNREIAILKSLNHDNIIKLIEIIDNPDHDKIYIV